MTDEQILAMAAPYVDLTNEMTVEFQPSQFTAFVRVLLAAGASEGQAEPIYQIRSTNSGTWHDVDKERYYSTRFERRIVYTHDLNNRVLALEASLYLKDAEIAALRERITGIRLEALTEARHVVFMALSLNDAFTSIEALVDKELKQ